MGTRDPLDQLEFEMISQAVRKSIKDGKVLKVERVQNALIWEHYLL